MADLVELNRLFAAWVETVYHRRVHSETGGHAARALRGRRAASPSRPRPSCTRRSCGPSSGTVTKTATVSLHGNTFEVDAALVGRRVECVFDPFDLDHHRGPLPGPGHGRRRGPGDRPPHPPHGPTRHGAGRRPATGIDYLGLLADRHAAELAEPSTTAHSRLLATTVPDQPPATDPRRKRARPMSIEVLQAHYGFTRMPFGRDLAPQHAAPHRRPRRSRRPHRLVRRRTRPRA